MRRILLPLLFLFTSSLAEGQDGFIRDFASKWQARATKTQAAQPKWAVPMFSPFPMLAQVYRSDFTRQRTSAGESDWNFGGGKGFNLIPFANTQIDILVPGYIVHGNGQQDGFGDMTLLGKYRFLARPEKKGNYILSGSLSWHIPTGSYKNGAPSALVHTDAAGRQGLREARALQLAGRRTTGLAGLDQRTHDSVELGRAV